MVLADLGRKITSALRGLNNASIINEEVEAVTSFEIVLVLILYVSLGVEFYAQRHMRSTTRSQRQRYAGKKT